MPERHERACIRQPVPRSTQDTWGLHPEVHFPDQCRSVQVDRSVSYLQHDLHLPHPVLPHDQDQRGCAAMDPWPRRQEKDAEQRPKLHLRQDALPTRLCCGSRTWLQRGLEGKAICFGW